MNSTLKLEAMKIVETNLIKLKNKAEEKGLKERKKAAEQFIVIKGEKYYTEEDIMDAYAADCFTCSQCDKYLNKLRKQKGVDWGSEQMLHEIVAKIYAGILENLQEEMQDLV